ncbi:hypothetical protein EC968_003198 [Mortierella alpina]|nr:hypothetical protein EC968_003198 [Mortierella alpina]
MAAILSPSMASPSFEPTMTTTSNNSSPADTTSNNDTTLPSTPTGSASTGTGLRRNNTLKAYLANKNKLKERQAINIIVDPTVLREESSGSDHETPMSPERTSPTTPSALMSPGVSGKRIDTDLEALDSEKKQIEDQLASITQQLNQFSQPSSPVSSSNPSNNNVLSPSLFPGMLTKEELTEKRTKLCKDLDEVLKRRRELLQSWARDYKSLKRSGSLAKRQEDLFWVTTA